MASDRIEGTKLTGPLRLWQKGGPERTLGRSSAVTVTALAAVTSDVVDMETHTITDADALVGDVILVSPNVAPEAGWAILAAWVDAAGSIKVKTANLGDAALTGGSLTLNYTIIR